MARGVNKVILIGNLGKDPEYSVIKTGCFVHISIATTETWRDKNTGENIEKTEWHNVVFFNNLAEIANKFLKKGSRVFIEGSLHTYKWVDNETGIDRFSTQIRAKNMNILSSPKSSVEESSIDAEQLSFVYEDIPF